MNFFVEIFYICTVLALVASCCIRMLEAIIHDRQCGRGMPIAASAGEIVFCNRRGQEGYYKVISIVNEVYLLQSRGESGRINTDKPLVTCTADYLLMRYDNCLVSVSRPF
jgi:hypothetical protein